MYLLLILAQEFTVQTPGQSVHVVWMRTHSKNLLNFNYALEESKANMDSVTKVLFEFEFKFKICQTCNIFQSGDISPFLVTLFSISLNFYKFNVIKNEAMLPIYIC